MLWTAVKIAAAVSAAVVVVFFIGLIVMVTRPVLLTGVSGSALSHSLNDSGDQPDCRKRADGSWTCLQKGNPATQYRVTVDWMGCWKATAVAGRAAPDAPKRRDGCIQLRDIVTFE